MAILGVPVVQINLHHSKGASAILARSMAAMQTAIALIQEPWLLNNAIKGLGECGNIFRPSTQSKIRTCIAVKGLNAIFMPQLSSGDCTVIQLRLNLARGGHRDVLVGSCYMPYDSKDRPPPKEVKELVIHARRGGLELLLGCDANSHHLGWGSTDINPRGESRKLPSPRMGEHRYQPERGEPPRFRHGRRFDHPEQRIRTHFLGLQKTGSNRHHPMLDRNDGPGKKLEGL